MKTYSSSENVFWGTSQMQSDLGYWVDSCLVGNSVPEVDPKLGSDSIFWSESWVHWLRAQALLTHASEAVVDKIQHLGQENPGPIRKTLSPWHSSEGGISERSLLTRWQQLRTPKQQNLRMSSFSCLARFLSLGEFTVLPLCVSRRPGRGCKTSGRIWTT